MARLLVTGGAGFIGANFVHHGCAAARRAAGGARCADATPATWTISGCAGARRVPFVQGDICDTALVEQLLREESLDTIVHFAAESHVDRSIDRPRRLHEANVIGTHSLLKAARRVWLEEKPNSVCTASITSLPTRSMARSARTTRRSPKRPRYAPNSPYSASKAASDHLVRAYHHTYGLTTTISNCSNNYGPYQFPEKLIPLIIVNILEGKALPVYGDGQNVRDWLHVEDHCRGIEAMLAPGKPGRSTTSAAAANCATSIWFVTSVQSPTVRFARNRRCVRASPDRWPPQLSPARGPSRS